MLYFILFFFEKFFFCMGEDYNSPCGEWIDFLDSCRSGGLWHIIKEKTYPNFSPFFLASLGFSCGVGPFFMEVVLVLLEFS